MIADLGFGALVITFVISVYGAAAAIYGGIKAKPEWVESARLAMLLTFPLISIAALSLIYLLVNGHYEIEYVSSVTSNSMPYYLKVTALWGGQAGSLVFWSWLMSAFASAVTLRKWDRDREFLPWVIVVSLITLSFFVMLVLLFENPFARIWRMPSGQFIVAMLQPAGATLASMRDGQGLNPLLRHPGMIVHPPMLYLGFVAFVIPYAFAIAALVTGRTDDRWIRITRRWTLVAWLFLSLGLIMGGRWAYDVLGWGGYWGWDPVEIAAFMPWLTGTAFLHSVMIQEKRGLLKHWNMVLIILTYSLVIFGTFLTRSGVLSSVHAFAQSAIGPMFFGFIGLTFSISLYLLLQRWDSLKSEGEMTSLLSREALFLLNNLLFMGILIVCFWGVIFPLVSELVSNQKVTVGPPFYERATAPLFAGLLLLMGIAPLSAWRHSTAKTLGRAIWKPTILAALVGLGVPLALGVRSWPSLVGFFLVALVTFVTFYEFWRGMLARHRTQKESLPVALLNMIARNRRRYGGYIIHLGVVLMAMGIIGIELFQQETQGTIPAGGSISLGNYTLTYKSLASFDTADGRNVARAVVNVEKNGKPVGELYPRRDFFFESQQPMTIPGVRNTWEDDLYVILVDWLPVSSQGASFKVYVNPLVNWLWLGGFVFVLGTLVAAWPDKESELEPARARRRTAVTVEA
ncbi:MAG: heme lyase CcmF/NrfE family subunit [Anaerolineales bacterium]|nr:heme lyase CcmF/NrfE family subunit [Anaerolineales bacterium]